MSITPPPGEDDALRARLTSPWTFRQKLARLAWYWTEATLFRLSPRPCYRWRALLLRLFGARVHATCRIRSTVRVEVPWNLSAGAHTVVGDHAILYCLGPVTLGERVTISQYAHLCAGTHDYTRPDLPLLRPPITVGDDAWVAADVFVGPGVAIGPGTVVGARSSVFGDLPAWKVCVGSPARPVKDRRLENPGGVSFPLAVAEHDPPPAAAERLNQRAGPTEH
jgi:putative colanic acid biosynthesis acetyltransferase WcaF